MNPAVDDTLRLDTLPELPGTARANAGVLGGLFEDGNSLVRAVVAAEVLGEPIALREPR
ncbi:MAG: hypothetical protein M3R35_02545 [Candidatus Eremiobacteraeota bacterium]|nr:hypothetical protein [Candidatus Eremiobacteraeota bacterium]